MREKKCGFYKAEYGGIFVETCHFAFYNEQSLVKCLCKELQIIALESTLKEYLEEDKVIKDFETFINGDTRPLEKMIYIIENLESKIFPLYHDIGKTYHIAYYIKLISEIKIFNRKYNKYFNNVDQIKLIEFANEKMGNFDESQKKWYTTIIDLGIAFINNDKVLFNKCIKSIYKKIKSQYVYIKQRLPKRNERTSDETNYAMLLNESISIIDEILCNV